MNMIKAIGVCFGGLGPNVLLTMLFGSLRMMISCPSRAANSFIKKLITSSLSQFDPRIVRMSDRWTGIFSNSASFSLAEPPPNASSTSASSSPLSAGGL